MNEEEAKQYHNAQKIQSLEYQKNLNSSKEDALRLALEGRELLEKAKEKVFIATVGFTHSGKTIIVSELKKRIPYLVSVNSNQIHKIIDSKFLELSDDNSIRGKGYWLRNIITDEIREFLIERLCEEGWWVASDSANLKKSQRDERFQAPRKLGYKTVLLWVNLPEEEIVERVMLADKEESEYGKVPVWFDLYEKVQKPAFEKPTPEEADIFITAEEEGYVVDMIINHLKKIEGGEL